MNNDKNLEFLNEIVPGNNVRQFLLQVKESYKSAIQKNPTLDRKQYKDKIREKLLRQICGEELYNEMVKRTLKKPMTKNVSSPTTSQKRSNFDLLGTSLNNKSDKKQEINSDLQTLNENIKSLLLDNLTKSLKIADNVDTKENIEITDIEKRYVDMLCKNENNASQLNSVSNVQNTKDDLQKSKHSSHLSHKNKSESPIAKNKRKSQDGNKKRTADFEPLSSQSSDSHYLTNTAKISILIPPTQEKNFPPFFHVPDSSSTVRKEDLRKLNKIKEFVDAAIVSRKTFAIGGHQIVRKSLMERGWVEKIFIHSQSPQILRTASLMQYQELLRLVDNTEFGHIYSRILKSKLLGTNQVDLYWDPPKYLLNRKDLAKPMLVNRFVRKGERDYTSKIGIIHILRQQDEYRVPGFIEAKYPTTFILHSDEWSSFLGYFRLSACLGVLKSFVNRLKNNKSAISEKGTVPISVFTLALTFITDFVKKKIFINIDQPTWDVFMDRYYQYVYVEESFYYTKGLKIPHLQQQAENAISLMNEYRPNSEFEGKYNVWLLKPAGFSRGNGIRIYRRLDQIKELLDRCKSLRFIAQKYIERPFLVHETKFDIRQWFLIAQTSPLTVWMYKDCYLRFSSQFFDLKNLHESVHLTNNSVQYKYQNAANRHHDLPADNIWHSEDFKAFLVRQGYINVWDEIVYPKMKQAILAVLVPSRKIIEQEKNAFELYGADFLLTPDFQPWLLEINSCPAMGNTTRVTSSMCPAVLEDVVKVVIDKAQTPSASTGRFELIFKETLSSIYPEFKNETKSASKPTSPTAAIKISVPKIKIVDFISHQSFKK